MANILVVEDDWEMNQGICYMLEKKGCILWLHTQWRRQRGIIRI